MADVIVLRIAIVVHEPSTIGIRLVEGPAYSDHIDIVGIELASAARSEI